MDIDLLKKLIKDGYSQRKICEEFGKSQSSVRYWLDKYQLKTDHHAHNRKILNGEKLCRGCNVLKPLNEFHVRRDTKQQSPTYFCKACNTRNVLERQVKFKLDCLQYKGNTGCIRCEYNKSYVALEFHHRNSNEKDFAISRFKSYKFNDTVAKELDKCDVLCANCHAEVHHELAKQKLMDRWVSG